MKGDAVLGLVYEVDDHRIAFQCLQSWAWKISIDCEDVVAGAQPCVITPFQHKSMVMNSTITISSSCYEQEQLKNTHQQNQFDMHIQQAGNSNKLTHTYELKHNFPSLFIHKKLRLFIQLK